MKEKDKKSEIVSLRLKPAVKKALVKMADEDRRKLADFIQLILTDVAEEKIKIK